MNLNLEFESQVKLGFFTFFGITVTVTSLLLVAIVQNRDRNPCNRSQQVTLMQKTGYNQLEFKSQVKLGFFTFFGITVTVTSLLLVAIVQNHDHNPCNWSQQVTLMQKTSYNWL